VTNSFNTEHVTATASSDNATATDKLKLANDHRASISISGGVYVAVVTLQRAFDDPPVWLDVKAFDSAELIETSYVCDEDCFIRMIVKSGNYTSGDPVMRLGTG